MRRFPGTRSTFSSVQYIFIAFLIFVPFDLFFVPVINTSVARALFLVLVLLVVAKESVAGTLQRSDWLQISALGLAFAIALSFLAPSEINVNLYRYYAPSFLLGLAYFIVAYRILKGSPVLLERMDFVYVVWGVLIVIFVVFQGYTFFIAKEIPLSSVPESIFPAGGTEHGKRLLHGKRMFLPTATPPRLSFFASVLSLYFFLNFVVNKKLIFLLLALALFVCSLATLSKSGVIALAVTLLIACMVLLTWSRNLSRQKFYKMLSYVFLAGVMFLGTLWLSGFTLKEVARDLRLLGNVSSEASLDRHLALRLDAIRVITDATYMEKLYGIGVGQYAERSFGSYTFMLPLTTLVETGLLGFGALAAMFLIITKRIIRAKGRREDGSRDSYGILIIAMFIYICVVNLFYEYKAFFPMWIMLAHVAAYFTRVPTGSREVGDLNRWPRGSV